MGSLRVGDELSKPHAVCVPYPAQGHINPMLMFAKLLHHRGFHITFVNTEYNHRRLIKSRGLDSVKGLPDFRFETIPDGLPQMESDDATQDIPALCESTSRTCLVPFKNLLKELNCTDLSHVPPVTCIISDGAMTFTIDAAEELGVPEVLFWTTSACGYMAYLHYHSLFQRGLAPLKDSSYLTNGYLETPIDWIPGLKDIRLKDIPNFIWTTNPDEFMPQYVMTELSRAHRATAIIINTFDDLEGDIVDAIRSILKPPVYTIGSLHSLLKHNIPEHSPITSIASNLWKEDTECLDWLDSNPPNSVVYVNFGSITVMSPQQLVEFAWGLANSNQSFLWVIRPDLVTGDSAILPPEFSTITKERSMLAEWCPQERVLQHPSVGGFLTHCGWNSTIESICSGVPMICWPFFAEQQMNCRYSCRHWGVGMEIDSNVKREEVERLVRELMVGEKGREMKKRAVEWKERAHEAVSDGGTSWANVATLIHDVLMSSKNKEIN
ncbi:hypothetical protein Scep_003672 [Stephania cephalantha]|uniref:Glycosyltransferase n=1 Tax=Stephania cephalantha TaxID=152367 RepID=A0AAP0KSF3_9MAGN